MTAGKVDIKAVFANGIKGGRLLALSFVLMSASFIAGCSNEVSVDQKLVDAYIDLRVAEIAYGATSPMSRLVRHDVLKKYGYTREEFLAETQAILDDERTWVPFQKAVNARIDSLLADKDAPAPGSVSPKADPGERPKSKMVHPPVPARKGGVE